jgi:F-type H+-transporting ATPase subunit b
MNLLHTLAAEGPNGKFLPSDIKEFYYGGIAFLIVAGFMAWKLTPVIKKALDDRGEVVRAELEAAEEAQAAADAEVAALKAKLGDADADALRLVEDAKSQAAQLKVDAAAKADTDAAAIRARAAADVEGMRAQIAADIEAEVTAKALAVAEEVAVANLDDATQNQLIESYIDQVGAS